MRMGVISAKFKEATDEQLEEIKKAKEKAMKQFEKDMEEYKEKGYYTLPDKTRSDQQLKDLKKNPAYPKSVLSEYMMFNKLYGKELADALGKEKVTMKERSAAVVEAYGKINKK